MPPVQRRTVFYIPGFDPFPARRYRELYRTEGAAQAALSGYRLEQHPGADPGSWRVTAEIDDQHTETELAVLPWADLVRDSMSGSILATYAQLVRTAWIYIRSGALGRLMRLRKGPVIAALYPVAVLLIQAVLALALTGAGAALGRALLPGWGLWPGLALGGVAGWALLAAFRRADGRVFAWYLMHDYAFSASLQGATPPALEARLDAFAARIGAALDSGVDEVLVVGHSSGAHLAVQTLARLLRARAPRPGGPELALLTLGQVMPMVSFLPQAQGLRSDLRALSERDDMTWVDVTAPGDGCAFALCDPVAVSGVATPRARWPLVFSAQFTRSLLPQTWRALRWRFFRLHFQYLCAFDAPLDYDYFQITAGPLSLASRYGARPPSASRITRALSPHTSVAA